MARKKSTPSDRVAGARRPAALETEAAAAGQSGDLQGLTALEESDSESVQELVEEGQFYEAAIVDGVENAPPPDAGPLRPHRRREDDLPPEYADLPPDEPIE
ncbi:MAG: hypothetical protein ACLP59_14780 [Bryobacteraceae bacterium]